MKILSKNSKKYFVEMSGDELANLIGMYSTYDDGFHKTIDKAIDNQDDIEISKIYHQNRSLNILLHQLPHNDARKGLKQMLRALEPIEQLIKGIPTVKEEK